MSNSLYHVHVINVAGESPISSSQIALFFEDKAFLTYDLPALLPEGVGYSRRCIDSCDCVVMVVGADYGETNASGVSQLHLSYLVAKTKHKPILTFVKQQDDKTSRRIADFIKLLQNQESQFLYYYRHESVLGQHLKNVYAEFEQQLTINRWVCEQATSSILASSPINSILALENSKNSGKTTPSTSAITNTGKYANIHTDMNTALAKDTRVDPIDSSIKEQSVTNNDTVFKGSKSGAIIQDKSNGYNKLGSGQHLIHTDTSDVLLVDELVIHYRAHAYQEGNLSDVSLSHQIKWIDVVKALTKLNNVFSTDGIYRSLNELISDYANDTIKKTMPKVHAVSRCQVYQKDFEWICNQLIHNYWIEVVDSPIDYDVVGYVGSGKKFWRLSKFVKDELDSLNMS